MPKSPDDELIQGVKTTFDLLISRREELHSVATSIPETLTEEVETAWRKELYRCSESVIDAHELLSRDLRSLSTRLNAIEEEANDIMQSNSNFLIGLHFK